jgi:hypothetical protein
MLLWSISWIHHWTDSLYFQTLHSNSGLLRSKQQFTLSSISTHHTEKDHGVNLSFLAGDRSHSYSLSGTLFCWLSSANYPQSTTCNEKLIIFL